MVQISAFKRSRLRLDFMNSNSGFWDPTPSKNTSSLISFPIRILSNFLLDFDV